MCIRNFNWIYDEHEENTPSPKIEKRIIKESVVDVEVELPHANTEGSGPPPPEINWSSRDIVDFVMSYERYERYMALHHQTKPTPSGPKIEKRIIKESVVDVEVELPHANTEGSGPPPPEINWSSRDIVDFVMSYERYERYMALHHQTKPTPSDDEHEENTRSPKIEKRIIKESVVDVEVELPHANTEGSGPPPPEINWSSRDIVDFVMSYERYERYMALHHQTKPTPSGPKIEKRIIKESVVDVEVELPHANTEGSVPPPPEINWSSRDIVDFVMSYERYERYMAIQHQNNPTPSGDEMPKRRCPFPNLDGQAHKIRCTIYHEAVSDDEHEENTPSPKIEK
ncbi:hypothetical protein SSX86_023456 [Deinandra increscens subsp. villosa]|uniref:Uncharacterized protein n=1 Tax=Deinandra increscens subsp. villosa TaxID=3103831 RepID=A0AAP0CSP5_9ASTR